MAESFSNKLEPRYINLSGFIIRKRTKTKRSKKQQQQQQQERQKQQQIEPKKAIS